MDNGHGDDSILFGVGLLVLGLFLFCTWGVLSYAFDAAKIVYRFVRSLKRKSG